MKYKSTTMDTVTSACDTIAKAMGVESKEYQECTIPLMKQIIEAEREEVRVLNKESTRTINGERRDEFGQRLVKIPKNIRTCGDFKSFLSQHIRNDMWVNEDNFRTQIYKRIYSFESDTLTSKCAYVFVDIFSSVFNLYKKIGDFRVYTSRYTPFYVNVDSEDVLDTYYPTKTDPTGEIKDNIRQEIKDLADSRSKENKKYNVTHFIG